jgi:hypothetical protein
MPQKIQRHPFFWVVIVAAIVIAALYIPVFKIIFHSGKLHRDLGWEYTFESGWYVVEKVDPESYAAGKLQKGDRILSIDGKEQAVSPNLTGIFTPFFPPTEQYRIKILRNGIESELQLRSKIESNSRNLIPIFISLFSSFVCFIIALVIGLAKPQERFTQLFTFTWLAVSLIYLAISLETIQGFFEQSEFKLIIFIMLLSLGPLEMATSYHFCYRFPPGIPEGKLWTYFRNFLYASAGAATIVYTGIRLAILADWETPLRFLAKNSDFLWQLHRSVDVLMVVSLALISILIIRNHLRIHEVNQRRKLRWVMFGSLIGVFPLMLLSITKLLFNSIQVNPGFTQQCFSFLAITSNLTIILIPLSIGLAIIKHRLFDIHVVVRQGLRYLFAKNVLRILLYLPAAIVIYTIAVNRNQKVTDVLFSNALYIVLTIAALVGLKFRNRFSDWLDRKFFREAYNSENILVSMIDEIKNFNSISEISKWVTLQLDSALHPKQIHVFYRRKERSDLALGYSSGSHNRSLSIPQNYQFLRVAESIAAAHQFPSKETSELPEEEKIWLQETGTSLFVPMNDSEKRLVGLLLLGEKKSEEPYTSQDRKMLEALGSQIAVICENLLLKERVDYDSRIRTEVLSRLQGEKRNILKECPKCGKCYDTNETVCSEDHLELALTLPVDRVVDSKYRLDKLLGRGGMGAVYQATDLRLNRIVAIKLLIGSMFGDRLALRRFEREAQASARLNHPNITTVYDFGAIEGEGAYLVMEFLQGFTLRAYLKQSGNVHPTIVAEWFQQILEGMKTAHKNGIVHRDLKPENIFISRNEQKENIVKILDFGLAKMKFQSAVETDSLTKPGTVLGTLSYMSPEQIGGSEIDERSDIFSIGVMVIETLTGKQAFTGKTYSDVVLAIIRNPFQLEGDREEIRKLNNVLQKCIAKDRNHRYSSLEEMQNDLIEAIRKVPPFPYIPTESPVHRSAAETRFIV